MPVDDDHANGEHGAHRSYDRELGVAEAFIAVRDQCPMGPVRRIASLALEAARVARTQGASSGSDDGGVLREQAFLVLTAIQGWRGERSRQVHRSLQAFLDATRRKV